MSVILKGLRKVPQGVSSALVTRASFHHDSVRDEPAPYPGVSSEFTRELRFILPEEVTTVSNFC